VPDNPLLQRFDVNDDVREFGHYNMSDESRFLEECIVRLTIILLEFLSGGSMTR
jgi:hypothetical protein